MYMRPNRGTVLQSLAWNMELRFRYDYIEGGDMLRNGSANDVPYGGTRAGLLWEDDTSFIKVPVNSFSDRRSSE